MASDATISSVKAEALALGLSGDQVDELLACVDAAGCTLADQATHTPLTMIDAATASRRRVAGVLGLTLLAVDVGGGEVQHVLEDGRGGVILRATGGRTTT
ncbi:MAG: hypothetical protein WAZ94_13505 [Phycisphaerales bacterium]